MANTVEALKERVMQNAKATHSCVDETIQAVKQTVHETVETIRRSFDVKEQVARHPWSMLGGAVVVGVLLAQRNQSQSSPELVKQGNWNAAEEAAAQCEPASAAIAVVQAAPPKPALKPWLKARFHQELNNLQTVAITAGVATFRDWLQRLMPGSRDGRGTR